MLRKHLLLILKQKCMKNTKTLTIILVAILYVFTGCEKNFETIETKDDTFILEVKNWFDEEIGNSLILDKHQNQLKSGSDNYCI